MKKTVSALAVTALSCLFSYQAVSQTDEWSALTKTDTPKIRTDAPMSLFLDSLTHGANTVSYKMRKDDKSRLDILVMARDNLSKSSFYFDDLNGNDIFERSEMSYADYADAYIDIDVDIYSYDKDDKPIFDPLVDVTFHGDPKEKAFKRAKKIFDADPYPLKGSLADGLEWLTRRAAGDGYALK